MASCCGVCFAFFTFLAAAAAVTALFVPFLVVAQVNGDGSSSSGAESVSFGGSCPFFDNSCTNAFNGQTTDQVLARYGCGSNMSTVRTVSVLAAVLAVNAFLVGCISAIRGAASPRVGLMKFGGVGLSGGSWLCLVISVNMQFNTWLCIVQSTTWKTDFSNQATLPMSAIADCAATGIMFWCMIGMLCSWWCGCCGEQPGRTYYTQVVVQQSYGQPLAANGYPAGVVVAAQPVNGQYAPQEQQQQQFAPPPYGQAAYTAPPQQQPYYTNYPPPPPQQQQDIYTGKVQ